MGQSAARNPRLLTREGVVTVAAHTSPVISRGSFTVLRFSGFALEAPAVQDDSYAASVPFARTGRDGSAACT